MNNQISLIFRNGFFNQFSRQFSKCLSDSQISGGNNIFKADSTKFLCQSKISIGSTGTTSSQFSTLTPSIGSQITLPNLLHFIPVRSISVYKLRGRTDPRKIQKNLRFKVHYPEDGVYTIQHLKTTKLAGRDPETGRVIYRKVGGGHKQNFRWVDVHRSGPKEEDSFLTERVISILRDPIRTSRLALVGNGNKLRYLIASDGLKEGDLIKTTSHIYRNPVRPKDGDAYPVGSLPFGTVIHCVEAHPGRGSMYAMSAGSSATVLKKEGDRIVVKLPSKTLLHCNPACMATVGRVSNVNWRKQIVGSAQRQRWLGNRPGSGLWQRKDGYCGRKFHGKKKPIVFPDVAEEQQYFYLKLNHFKQDPAIPVVPSVMLKRRQTGL